VTSPPALDLLFASTALVACGCCDVPILPAVTAAVLPSATPVAFLLQVLEVFLVALHRSQRRSSRCLMARCRLCSMPS